MSPENTRTTISNLYINLCSNLIDQDKSFQKFLHEEPSIVEGALSKLITTVAKPKINYKIESELEQSISQFRAILIESESLGGIEKTITDLEPKDIPSTLGASIDVMRRVVTKLKATKSCPERVTSRLSNEIDDLEKLSLKHAAPRAKPENKIQRQIAYIQNLIDKRSKKEPLPSFEEMRNNGLSEAAIQVLLNKKFVPYDRSPCQNLPINLHCRASAHNACISSAEDEFGNRWAEAQQKMTEIELLAFGVRQMELNIAAAPENTKDEGRVMICHGQYLDEETQKRGHDAQKKGHYESFHGKLWEATEWLKANPTETLIINLDCLRDTNLTAEQINNELAAFADMIFTPDDLEVFRLNKRDPTAWPTPGEMGQKRVLVMYPEKMLEDKPRTFKHLTFDQESLTHTTIPGISTGVSARGEANKAERTTLLGLIGNLFSKKNKKEETTPTQPAPFFMLYHTSAFPIEGTLPRYAYMALRTLLIRPLNFIFGTHLPDLSNEKLIIPNNSPGAIFQRIAACEKQHLQPTSIHMDNYHEFAAVGGNGPLNGINAYRASQYKPRASTLSLTLEEVQERGGFDKVKEEAQKSGQRIRTEGQRTIPPHWKKFISDDEDD